MNIGSHGRMIWVNSTIYSDYRQMLIAILLLSTSINVVVAGESDHVFLQTAGEVSADQIPPRPNLLLELGENFLEPGQLGEGWRLPTGAIWRPALWVFGNYQTALQYRNDDGSYVAQWIHRLDLLANLRLSGTERIFLGVRPVDEDRTQFTRYTFAPSSESGFESEFNLTLDTLFFEGDFGELFPALDSADTRALDIGFSMGRQRINKQNGMLINDTLDSIGVIKNNILTMSTSNVSISGLVAWNEIHLDDNREDDSVLLTGLFSTIETFNHSISIDFVYVEDQSNDVEGVFSGVSSTQRIGGLNSTFSLLGSLAIKNERNDVISDGVLLTSELSITPHATHDLIYLNTFYGLDDFSSAARSPETGKALGNVGISFAGVGVSYGPVLGNSPKESYGGALGYQQLFLGGRKQLILEYAFRNESNINLGGHALSGRYQQALGRHYIIQYDVFYARLSDDTNAYGTRAEFRVKF